jgi:hypothetical protein
MSRGSERNAALRLSPVVVEAVAQRVAELLRRDLAQSPRLLTPSEVAEQFAVSRTWVYEHADELGAVRLGAGPRARLRFDANRVARAIAPPTSNGDAPRDVATAAGPDDLLPVYGRLVQRDRASERSEMGRDAVGEIRTYECRDGLTTFRLRFRAYGRRENVTLGTEAEGWSYKRAEIELQNTLAFAKST